MFVDICAHGAAESDADVAVCHDRAGSDPVCHPPQHLGKQMAIQDQAVCAGAH